ncbi:MAG: ATP-binding protein [Clostridia bacterium]|nr:ATP-binding protein [Clostridia bacterium]
MVKLIVGKKGTGKTKALIDGINNSINTEHGDIIFICNGDRHILDVNHSIRLIDVADIDTGSFRIFKGFINGILSQNYDITSIFVDSLLKIVPDDIEGLTDFITDLDSISEKNNIKFTICISADKSELPEGIYKYIG